MSVQLDGKVMLVTGTSGGIDDDNMEINGATIPIDRCWSTGYGVSLIFASAGSAGVPE